MYSKICLKRPLKIIFQDKLLLNAGQKYCRMPLGAFSNIFDLIKLPFDIKTFVLSIFEWPLKTYAGYWLLIITQVNRMSKSRRVLAIGGKQRSFGLHIVCFEMVLYHNEPH